MKVVFRVIRFCAIYLILNLGNVFATAHLEGEETEKKPSIFDKIDSDLLMANWYKIVLIGVSVLCVIGLIVSNIIWIKKNKRNKKR